MNKTEIRTIHVRYYDNAYQDDGTPKPNVLLGKYEVLEDIFNETYSEMFIGRNIKNNKLYFIWGKEVSFKDGGMIYTVTELKKINKLTH